MNIQSNTPSIAGGRGHLPRSRGGVACRQCRARQSRAVEGDERDRALPHRGARRSCRAVRGLRARARRLQFLPQPLARQGIADIAYRNKRAVCDLLMRGEPMERGGPASQTILAAR